jgi:hypothetical protein
MGKLNYIFFSYDGYPFPIAKRLIDEGNQVIVCQVDNSDLGIETGWTAKGTPEEDEARKSIYEGIFPLGKMPYKEVLKFVKDIKNKEEWFVAFPFNNLCKISEKFLEMGFTNGLFPLTKDFELEKDRKKGQDFVKKNIKGIKLSEAHEFTKVSDAIKFLQETDKIYALKSDGNYVDTTVPLTNDVDFAKNELIFQLLKNEKDYQKGGFILEEKIINPKEFVPALIFYNGKLISTNIEMETRLLGAGEVGYQTGGNQSIVIATEPNSKIHSWVPNVVFEEAKKRKGLYIFDTGLLYDEKGNPHFMEFCGNRWGWGTILAEISMSRIGDCCASEYFEGLVAGRNPLKYKYGAYLALYNMKHDGKLMKSGIPIQWKPEIDSYWFPYQIQKSDEYGKEMTVNTGYCDELIGYLTGVGNTLEEAVDDVYNHLKISFNGLYYRPKEDFLSTSYNAAIKNRIKFLNENGLINIPKKLGENFEHLETGEFIVEKERFEKYVQGKRKTFKLEEILENHSEIDQQILQYSLDNPSKPVLILEFVSKRQLYLRYGKKK